MKLDLTKGNITKSLFVFALPMILGNMLQQFYNIADTWVVGRYVGAEALAAAGSAYSLMTFLTSILIGMCMGSGAVFSYYVGQADHKKLKDCMQTAFMLIGALAVLLTVIVLLLINPILYLLNIPDTLFDLMRQYVFIVFLGIFFVFLYNYFAFLQRAVGNSVIPLVFLGIASVLNVGLDLFFVICLHWGLQGAAAATVMAQAVAGIGLWIYTAKTEPELKVSIRRFLQGEKPVKEILQFSLTSSAQQSVMNFGILMVQGLVNSFGASVMAAFAAAVKIDTFAYMPAQEFGNAYSIFVSQNFGASQKDRIRKGTRAAFMTSALFCGIISVAVYFLAGNLMQIFIDAGETEIIRIGMGYLRIEGTFYALIGILFLFYGYFRGVNRPGISFVLTIISLGTRVALAYLLAGIQGIGVTGIWASIPIGWMLADLVGIVLMRKMVLFTRDR